MDCFFRVSEPNSEDGYHRPISFTITGKLDYIEFWFACFDFTS